MFCSMLLLFPFVVFHHGAVTVRVQKGFEVFNAHAELFPEIGVRNHLPGLLPFKDICRGSDAVVFTDGLFPADKGLVRHDAVGLGSADQRVARNARGRLVGLAKASVDHQQGFRPSGP